ncbi:hypothetical protein BL253_02715 [Pseudofrankia asymbiotica]|uniref:Uncharacterized protein n=2 Tax=Pseudofrankia asymbiotica TaxID=1834516 RepID=A0A1V2IL20_9ACTN|nr:hypothetical protein BL253_02715 [Pseudofrankia asymbiotica]
MALPASAAGFGDTTVTLELTGATLDISVPTGPVSLGVKAVTDSSASGPLGLVTVTDNRSADPAAWAASVSATPFQSGAHVLSASYDTGVVTSTGIPISQWTINTPVTLTPNPQQIVTLNPTWPGGGNNSAAWNPTITVAIPPNAIAGTYSSVVTHSVI